MEGGRKEENGCNPSYCPPAVLLKKKYYCVACVHSTKEKECEIMKNTLFHGVDGVWLVLLLCFLYMPYIDYCYHYSWPSGST